MSIVHVSNASELIRLNENTYDALQAIEFEAMDTGYAEFLTKDLEIFTSSDENFHRIEKNVGNFKNQNRTKM